MTPQNTPNHKNRPLIRQWLDDIKEHGRGLTDWEEHFVESLDFRWRLGGGFSEKQIEILEGIYAEKTP